MHRNNPAFSRVSKLCIIQDLCTATPRGRAGALPLHRAPPSCPTETFVSNFRTSAPHPTVHILKNVCRDDTEALDLIDAAVRRPEGRPLTVSIRNNSRPVGTT